MSKPLGFMYALGLKGPPTEIDVRGHKYVLETLQKHDFWAATGFYRQAHAALLESTKDNPTPLAGVREAKPIPRAGGGGGSKDEDLRMKDESELSAFILHPSSLHHGPHPNPLPEGEGTGNTCADPARTANLPPRLVAKFNRQSSFLGLPLRWIGRRLRNRERRAYAKLQDVPGIPALLGDITDTGFLHAYVEGSPLKKGMPLDDHFFANLFTLIDTLHQRGIAYVDTNKPENILLGDDGLPYLIDFQISFDASACWPRWLGRKLLRNFYEADVYHALKQKRRFRPDLLTTAERERFERVTLLHKLHRVIRKPYFMIRRPMMRWLERSGRAGKIGSD